MKIKTDFKVRTYECDSYNHVNNAVYLNYLEYARADYMDQTGFRYLDFVEAGYFLYVTHIDIHYKASARYGDELEIETFAIKLGAVSGTFKQVIRRKNADGSLGDVCAEAEVSWACVNKEGRPSKIPSEFMIDAIKPDAADLAL